MACESMAWLSAPQTPLALLASQSATSVGQRAAVIEERTVAAPMFKRSVDMYQRSSLGQ